LFCVGLDFCILVVPQPRVMYRYYYIPPSPAVA
jgi:hypothetical protein